MEARILELIQHPENISAEDIAVLQKEISKYPYMQSLRTLQLSAVHHFDTENYQKELTKTAAYTTDKKILYQFINRKEIEQRKEAAKLRKIILAKPEAVQGKPLDVTIQTTENQIQENKEPEILPFKIEEETVSDAPFRTRKEDLNYTKETILDQFDKISDKEEDFTSVKPSEISFNGFDSFLPDVKFTVPVTSETKAAPVIEEKVQEKIELKEEPKQEIDFQNVQTFVVEEAPLVNIEEKIETVEEQPVKEEEVKQIVAEKPVEIIPEPEVHFEWKPMNFINNPLDSQIKKQAQEISKPIEDKVEVKPEIPEPKVVVTEPEMEKEVIIVKTEEAEEIVENLIEEVEKVEQKEEVREESNIPNFVNTWQNWLKIDRAEIPKVEEVLPQEKIIEKKAEIIDRFIEDNPRISQLKEESNYVIKEKTDDISHLMTETLAKLYVEQKLYAKAIKAYEVLQKKHPEKQEKFKEKIQEIKSLRQNK